ncbi:hypothetical protein OPV22_006871 [Ensete ventricosum]|uniref:Uncharacterized protein n=1 Tax=Ensete ventricosum TaxID=4639 RepID=A0AAV8RS25_ENSVE|nr:hypothetical protein OPV22_006871 [Ensete ventricosum]
MAEEDGNAVCFFFRDEAVVVDLPTMWVPFGGGTDPEKYSWAIWSLHLPLRRARCANSSGDIPPEITYGFLSCARDNCGAEILQSGTEGFAFSNMLKQSKHGLDRHFRIRSRNNSLDRKQQSQQVGMRYGLCSCT